MSGIDSPIPLVPVALWACVALVLTVFSYFRLRRALSWRVCCGIVLARVGAMAAVLVLLLQPYWVDQRPDRDGFRLALLVDASQSMGVRDLPDRRQRIDVLQESLRTDSRDSLIQRLSAAYRVEIRTFASSTRVVRPDSPLPLLPGSTSLGDALLDVLAESSSSPLGGVLLLSDGHHNTGTSPSEACKLFRGRAIPVSTVGVGQQARMGDVRLRFASDQVECRKGDEVRLTLELENRFSHDVDALLRVGDGTETVVEQRLTLPAGSTVNHSVAVEPWRAGFISYRAVVDPVEGDPRRDNDVDYVGVQVKEPDMFSILFLGGSLGWEYRFLKILADGNRQLSLAAAIQTGPNNIYQVGVTGDEDAEGRLDRLPAESDQLNRYQAIVLDTRAVPVLGETGIEALRGFVDRRGGGLLMFGPTEDLPESLMPLLPIQETPARQLARRERLDVNPEFIFDGDPAGVLEDHAGLALEPGDAVFFTEMTKRSAREAARLRHTDLAALSAQSYGSGRSAYLGMESSWRWRLKDTEGESDHAAFWNALLVWLSSSSRRRVETPVDGSKAGVGEAVSLGIDVLGRDFRPSPDAQVQATVTEPTGDVSDVPLNPDPTVPGRYDAVFFPKEAGEHTLSYRIRTGSEVVTEEAHFLARKIGVENEDTGYREDVLRDVSRITGGRFHDYRQLGTIGDIPLSPDVPMERSRRFWTRHAAVILLFFFCLGSEWTIRRRFGLK